MGSIAADHRSRANHVSCNFIINRSSRRPAKAVPTARAAQMSVTKIEKVLHLLRKPDARLVRLHSNNGGAGFTSGRAAVPSRMKSRNCCWGAMTYSPTATACFPATLRAGAWATGVTGPNVCEGGRVSDERPFGGLPRGTSAPSWPIRRGRTWFSRRAGPLSRPALRHYGRGRDRAVAG